MKRPGDEGVQQRRNELADWIRSRNQDLPQVCVYYDFTCELPISASDDRGDSINMGVDPYLLIHAVCKECKVEKGEHKRGFFLFDLCDNTITIENGGREIMSITFEVGR